MLTFRDSRSADAATIVQAAQPGLIEGGQPHCDQKPEALCVSTKVGLFQDIPGWIWRAYLSAWATIFGLFLAVFTVGAEATFAVSIAALTGLMAFGLPVALVAQSGRAKPEHKSTVDTYSGPLSIRAAAAQIVLIPVGGIVGLTAFIIVAM
jgi:hypothetical protein